MRWILAVVVVAVVDTRTQTRSDELFAGGRRGIVIWHDNLD